MRRWPKRRYAAHDCIGFLRQYLRYAPWHTDIPGSTHCSKQWADGAFFKVAQWRHNFVQGIGGEGEMTNGFLSCSGKARQAINLAGILHSLELRSWIKLGWGDGCARWDTWGHLLYVCLSRPNWILVSNIAFNLVLTSARTFSPLLKGPIHPKGPHTP